MAKKEESKPKSDSTGSRSGRADERVRDVMTANPRTVQEKSSIQEAARLMLDRDCGAVPVVAENGRKVIGIITDRDIVVRLVAEGKDPLRSKVADAMTRKASTVREDSAVDEVLSIMSKEQIRRVPVVNASGELVGIVSIADIANETGEDRKLGQAVDRISNPGGKHAQ